MGSGEQEQDFKARVGLRTNRLWRWARTLVLLAIVGWAVARLNAQVGKGEKSSGFGQGLWHGAVMPGALPLLVLGKDVVIYAPLNTGRSYKLGYILGVNACGLVFFGILFSQYHKRKRR